MRQKLLIYDFGDVKDERCDDRDDEHWLMNVVKYKIYMIHDT